MQLTQQHSDETVQLYRVEGEYPIQRYVASTPETRRICSDPLIYGVEYTHTLERAGASVLRALKLNEQFSISEENTVVLHILRGGLNFGLRNALYSAYEWNAHSSAFISSQRAKDQNGDWYITENRYQKVYLPKQAHIIFGDVVATGVSLEHALLEVIRIADEQQSSISGFTFFTIGGQRSEEIIERIDQECRTRFGDDYRGSRVIYFEGIFGVAEKNSKLHIALSGTDLLHSPALLAPEFIAFQQKALSYAIERCTIYDAGSRAFHIEEYLEDVRNYWKQVLKLAEDGMTYSAYLKERFPEDARLLSAEWVQEHDSADMLKTVSEDQIHKTSI